jgi:hypothetical protein
MFLPQVDNLNELPETLESYRTQQFRWLSGACACAWVLARPHLVPQCPAMANGLPAAAMSTHASARPPALPPARPWLRSICACVHATAGPMQILVKSFALIIHSPSIGLWRRATAFWFFCRYVLFARTCQPASP